jgi:nicotinamide mononucleotide adenylyltransferase
MSGSEPGFKTSAAAEYVPPIERPTDLSLPLDQILKTIPTNIFQYNPHFSHLEPVILVSSGSFSPITTLHVQMMTMIREYLMIKSQQVHVIGGLLSPVHDAYGKSSLIDQNHRYEMCKLATDGVNWLGVTSIEIQHQTWIETRIIFDQIQLGIDHIFENKQQSIQLSIEKVIKPRIVLCIGSDVFLGFRNRDWWSYYDIEQYCTKYRIAVVLRESDLKSVETLLKTHPVLSKYPNSIWIIPPSFSNSVSSTLVRNQLLIGGSLYGLVHHNVENYIHQHQLYGIDARNESSESQFNGGEDNYHTLFQ